MASARKTADPFAEDTVSETNQALEISVTIKQSSTTGSPWVIIRGSGIEEVEGVFADPERLKTLLDNVDGANKHFASKAPAPAAATGGGGGTPNTARDQAPGGATKSCKHGEMVFRSGTKNGRSWSAFMCPSPQGTADQCAPVFNK